MSVGIAMHGCDTHDMIVVHRVFRREFGRLPELVRAVGAGDTSRAAAVGEHADALVEVLQRHDTGEDELIWPRLRERRDLDTTAIERLEGQHERIAEILEQVRGVLPTWTRYADSEAGGELAALSEQLFCALDEHLNDEENAILPLVANVLSRRQWDDVVKHDMRALPRRRLQVYLGQVMQEVSRAERRAFMRHVPLVGRVGYLIHHSRSSFGGSRR